jgi:hypothetical protein
MKTAALCLALFACSPAFAQAVVAPLAASPAGVPMVMAPVAPANAVLRAGTPAWAELTGVRNKGMWGKSGKLDAQMLFMRLNGRQIRLTGAFDDKGVTGTAGVVGAVLLLPIAGFFMTGTSAVLPKGGTVGGFIDEDVPLAFAAASVMPMQVPVAAPAMPVSMAAPTAVAPVAAPLPSTPAKKATTAAQAMDCKIKLGGC